MHARSDRAEMWLTGTRNLLTTAVLTGNVQLHSEGTQTQERSPPTLPLERPRCTLPGSKCSRRFMPKTACGCRRRMPRAEPACDILPVASVEGGAQTQDIEMTAPVMTSSSKMPSAGECRDQRTARIVITQPDANQKTVVTAARFTAKFTDKNRLATLHGEPDAKIVGSLIDPNKTDASKAGSTKAGAPAQPDRVSTSQMLDVAFLRRAESGRSRRLATLLTRMARRSVAQRASTRPPIKCCAERIASSGGHWNDHDRQTIRMNRATGDAFAEAT